MRKSRNVVKDIDPSLYEKFSADSIFSLLEELEIAVPSWATMMFCFARHERKSFDASFFEESQHFFLWYSRVLIGRADDLKVISLTRKDGVWLPFAPPTLIGVNLRTKLR